MEGPLALLMPVFIVFIVSFFRHRSKELAFKEKQLQLTGGADAPQLAALEAERKQLRERVEHLESIVCSVDFELNQRLNKLAAQTSLLGLPPVPATASAPAPIAAPPTATAPTAALSPAHEQTAALSTSLRPGQVVLGRYTIERALGSGGMGAVFLAADSRLGERVALKTIHAGFGADARILGERFRREVQAARRVTHPNVCRIHDLGEDGALLFLSMELVEGESLWQRVKRLGRLPLAEAVPVLQKVAAGVAAAHAAGVVHRDLKPQNILLGGTATPPEVKIIDFGLAKISHLEGMTATGMILGTPDYMAPEQVRGQEADVRSDVYALGATAYAVLAGRPPFQGATTIAIGYAALHETPAPIATLRPDAPKALTDAVDRALAKDPNGRFPDAGAFARAAFGG